MKKQDSACYRDPYRKESIDSELIKSINKLVSIPQSIDILIPTSYSVFDIYSQTLLLLGILKGVNPI